jgi:hypothetical protein
LQQQQIQIQQQIQQIQQQRLQLQQQLEKQKMPTSSDNIRDNSRDNNISNSVSNSVSSPYSYSSPSSSFTSPSIPKNPQPLSYPQPGLSQLGNGSQKLGGRMNQMNQVCFIQVYTLSSLGYHDMFT